MEHKIPGNYYLVEVPGWNDAGFAIAEYAFDEHLGIQWIDQSVDMICTAYVKSYKALDKVGKMRPFAVLTIPRFT
jgi:hypothetical protein